MAVHLLSFSAIPTSSYLYTLLSIVPTLRILILRVEDQLHTLEQHPLHSVRGDLAHAGNF